MKQEKDPIRKKRLIIDFVRRVNQFHPFSDANTRTCYILMNVLFMRHNLSPFLLINPNRLDLCTLEQVTTMVDQGVGYFKQLVAARGTKSTDSISFGSPDGYALIEKPIDFPEKEQAACVVRHMIAIQNTRRMFPRSIRIALEKNDPSWAFRRACAAKSSKWALLLINQSARDIDFAATTSKHETGTDLVRSNGKMSRVEREYLLSVIELVESSSNSKTKIPMASASGSSVWSDRRLPDQATDKPGAVSEKGELTLTSS